MSEDKQTAWLKKVAAKQKEIRERTPDRLELKRTPKYLKDTFTDFDGSEIPLKLRYYQVQGLLHLAMMPRFLLGDDTGLGKCCGFNTYIPTDEGLLQMGEIEDWSGMKPDTFHPMSREVHVLVGDKRCRIKNFYYGGVKPTITMTTRYGFKNTGSLVHPMLVFRNGEHQWVQTRHLREGDFLCVERREAPFPAEESALAPGGPVGHMTQDLARFLGYYIGEGSLTARGQIRLSQCPQKNPEIHADILSLLQQLFGHLPDHPEKADLYLNDTRFRRWLADNGLDYCLSKNRVVPSCILRATRESSREFLRALFEGEAHISSTHIEYSTASEELGRQVQVMLLRFGIVSKRSPKVVKGYDHTYWRLTICGRDAELFQSKIGFISTRKQEALATCIGRPRNTNHDVVPQIQWVFEQALADLKAATSRAGANSNRRGSGIKQFGVSVVNTLNNIRNYSRNPSYQFIELTAKLLQEHSPESDACALLNNLLDTRYFYDPVVSIEDGEEEVFDIEVDDPEHCFVGNGLVNHNTLQAIAALCYRWEKEPDRKALVLTTKSATKQWAKEFVKFGKGIKVIVCKGTKKQRLEAHEEWRKSTGPTVMVMGYASARGDFTQLQGDKGYIVIFDECFDYHTPIMLADGTTELIGKIVCQEQPVDVLSWNPDTGRVEPKRVVDWHRNPLQRGRRTSLRKITFRFGNSVRVTRNHQFYTSDGRQVQAGHLRKGSEVRFLDMKAPTEMQRQIVLGSLLGDASISGPERSLWGVEFTHSTKQGEYLRFKRDILSSLGVSGITGTTTGFQPLSGEKAPVERFRLKGNATLTSMLWGARIWRDGGKHPTKNWLDAVGPLGLAVWYGDDGSLLKHICEDGTTSYQITLHTQGFSRDEQELLAGWLHWRWGVQAQVKTTKPRSDRNGGTQQVYPYLYIPNGEAQKFLGLLPGALPGVEYKFPGKPLMTWRDCDVQPCPALTTDWVTSVGTWKPQVHQKYVYNIEVEGNHNYFAGGSLVANCTAFKNPKAQIHQVCKHLSVQADRAWGLTATLIKNHLMEGHGIYSVLVPGLFGSVNNFMYYYCIVEMMMVGKGRKVPRIVGYFPEKVGEFREHIWPYFLGRPKHEVATELPTLTRQVIEVGVTDYQDDKYREALSGLLVVGEGTDEEEEKEVSKLTAITYCQQIVNHPDLIGCDGASEKLDVLIDKLTDGDLAEEKVIVFTRFRKMVDVAMPVCKKAKIKAVRITGSEGEDERQAAAEAFQNPNSGVNVVFITMAGSDAINLQAAKAIIFYDSPWSAGDYIQCLDSDTEILTRTGWASRGSVRVGDDVAALDPNTSKITWQVVRSVVDRPLTPGESMFETASRHLNLRVTGGHRMLFRRKTIKNKKAVWPGVWQFQTAGEMSQEKAHYQIPASGYQEAPGVDLTTAELEFLGWFLSDGCINRSNHQVSITQAAHQPQIEDLRGCLKGCGFDWSEYDRNPSVHGGFENGKPQVVFSIPKGGQGGSRARKGWGPLEPYLDKDLSPLLEDMTSDQLASLLLGLHLGDGSKYRGDGWTQRSYHIYTSRRVFADRLQSLCVRRGFRCNLKVRPAAGSRQEGYLLHIKKADSWSLCGAKNSEGRTHMRSSSTQEGEPVWCVENDLGTLVVRRKGKVSVVGNCLGRMIRIGSKHDRCFAMHLVARWSGGATVDQRVLDVLSKKMNLIEAVLGERVKGMSSGSADTIEVKSEINDIFNALKADAQEAAKR